MPAKPAIEGGKPVRKKLLPYGHQTVRDADARAVLAALKSEWITQGPLVAKFEKALAKACGAREVVAMSSGTAALHAAYAVAGLQRGFVGLTTPLTFSASANAIVYCGAKPAFVDVAKDWPLMDPNLLGLADPRVRVVVPVDYAGHPSPVAAIRKIAHERDWIVVEDAAHALGASVGGKPVGSLADMTVFSFHPVKHITTGEGGAVVTDHAELAEALRSFRHHGIVRPKGAPEWVYDIPHLGHNFRITDFQCALGLSQLRSLRSRVARRRAIARRFNKAFRGLAGIEPPTERPGVKSSYHLYAARLHLDELRVDRAHVFKALRAEGLGVQVHYIPVHLFSYYREFHGFRPGDFPNAEAFYEREITLPLFDGMTEKDIADVIAGTTKVLEHYAK